MRAGLFEKGRPSSRPLANQRALLGSPEHRAVAREAVRKSLVLLKNAGGVLPLRPNLNVLVAGRGADDIGMQSGGWTITWQGTGNSNADFPGATSIFAGIRATVAGAGGTATLSVDGIYQSRPDVAIVVFGETPYAEWHGDLRSIDFEHRQLLDPEVNLARPAPEGALPVGLESRGKPRDTAGDQPHPSKDDPPSPDLALLQRLKRDGIPVVAVFLTGRPLFVTPALDASDAFVVAWLPGTEGEGVADVLFRQASGEVNADFTGRLSFSWPRTPGQTGFDRHDRAQPPLFPYGFGLSYCNPACNRTPSQALWRTQPSSMSRRRPASR